MARVSQTTIRQGADYATTVDWQIKLIEPPLAVGNIITPDEFDFRCESADVPKRTNQPVEIMIRGFRTRQPGITLSSGTLNITMLEKLDNKISEFITAWRDAVYNARTGEQEDTSRVRAIIRLDRLDRRNNVIWSYRINDAILEDYDPVGGTLQGATADLMRPLLTLNYDDFIDGARL